MPPNVRSSAAFVCAVLWGASCLEAAAPLPPATTHVRSAPFDPAIDDYFAAPWPDDRRLDADGTLRTLDFPNPRNGAAFDTTLRTGDRLVSGWGLAATLFVTTTGALDAQTLNADVPTSVEATAPVQLIDLDRAVRQPIELQYTPQASVFTPVNTLAVRPIPGLQLRPKTRHALVLTRRVRDAAGERLGPDEHLRAVMEDRASASDQAHFAPALEVLDGLGIARADIAGLVVFTTQAVEDELLQLRDSALALPAPVVTDVARRAETATYDVYEARYVAPNFMEGTPPYETSGGAFVRESDGRYRVGVEETMRLKACIPVGDVPEGGFPVVIYSHGTGGSFDTVVGDKTCELLASVGVATFATDQVLSGPRAPAGATCLGQDVEVCFFNVVNATAGRNLLRQSAIDQLSLRRALASFALSGTADRFGRDVDLRLDDIGFLGHSQGALTGSLSVPLDPNVRYAVLSSTGGHLSTTLLSRTDPDVKGLLESDLYLAIEGVESLDAFHPAVALIQTLAEAVDPLNAAPLWLRRPVTGAKHVLMVNGWLDGMTPIATAEFQSISGGLTPRASGFRHAPVFDWAGLRPVDGGIAVNAATGDTARQHTTGVFWELAEYDHFPFFRSSVVRDGVRSFFSSAFATGAPALPAIEGTP